MLLKGLETLQVSAIRGEVQNFSQRQPVRDIFLLGSEEKDSHLV